MKTVFYSCPFVPAEWIAAHGWRPSRIAPRRFDDPGAALVRQGFCPYARAVALEVSGRADGDAAVLTTACDQMRRAAELVARGEPASVFLMHVPATWETAAAHRLYVDELRRLGRFLTKLGGAAPAGGELAAVMLEYDSARASLRAARGRLSSRRFTEAVLAFHRLGPGGVDPGAESCPADGVPVALAGGPLPGDMLGVFDLIEEAGGAVVLDATTTGERTLPAPFDRRQARSRPLEVLADAYFGHIPDAFRRPNTALYEWLQRKLAERGVRGIVFVHHTWCDTWRAEAQRMQEWSGLPFLVIEGGGGRTASCSAAGASAACCGGPAGPGDGAGLDGRTVSRLQSFLEVLQ